MICSPGDPLLLFRHRAGVEIYRVWKYDRLLNFQFATSPHAVDICKPYAVGSRIDVRRLKDGRLVEEVWQLMEEYDVGWPLHLPAAMTVISRALDDVVDLSQFDR